jgi:hypothetical protein
LLSLFITHLCLCSEGCKVQAGTNELSGKQSKTYCAYQSIVLVARLFVTH